MVLDYIIAVPQLPSPGLTVPVEGVSIHFGGTGGNIARVAGHLGVPTALASFVGPDFPTDYRQALKGEGVDLTDLEEVAGYATPKAWIFNDPHGAQAVIIDQGPMKDAAKFAVKEHTVRTSEVVHLGTGRPDYYREVAVRAKSLGRIIAFDPSQEIHYVYDPQAFRDLLHLSDFFFANEAELEKALEMVDRREPKDLLEYCPTVVATYSDRGSRILSRGGREVRIPCVRASAVVDPTGAGDAYRAGFYAGLHRGFDLGRCGLVGATVASFIIEALGPQGRLPSWAEVQARMKAYELK